MNKHNSALDGIEVGCTQCEIDQCNGTVGYGGSPDESGETTLDAMIMDGPTHDVGAVGDLRRVKQAIAVARAVMKYTKHTMLVGDAATAFALEMGFQQTSLTTNTSKSLDKIWKMGNCQPNYRQNVVPSAGKSCGPYTPSKHEHYSARYNGQISADNHDTIGMIAIDSQGRIAGGTSTNGATHKVPGRVGDSPIAGAGAYVEQDVGGAAATGDGDVMMRFLPSYHAVALMGAGMSPSKAAQTSLAKIIKMYPDFSGAVIAVNMNASHGAACHGISEFPYSFMTTGDKQAQLVTINCINSMGNE